MTYDPNSPSAGHGALSDIDVIRTNKNDLRKNEASAEASPPSSPVAGQDWHTSDTQKRYVRTNAGSWLYLWSVTDPPAKTSDVTAHTGSNITNAVTVHGIRQGSGNAFDADLLDGQHGSYYLAATHATASSGVHGSGSNVLLSAPTTTPFLIVASSAPTGWTQVTTWNDRVIRVVSGTGGATGGGWTISGINTSADHTHNVEHTHSLATNGTIGSRSLTSFSWVIDDGNGNIRVADSSGSLEYTKLTKNTTTNGGNSGTGGAHAHTFDGNWRPAYLDVIAVTKNA